MITPVIVSVCSLLVAAIAVCLWACTGIRAGGPISPREGIRIILGAIVTVTTLIIMLSLCALVALITGVVH